MAVFDDVLREFGALLGLEDFKTGANGVAALEIEGLGVFCLEAKGAEVTAYLVRTLPTHALGAPAKALALCDWRRGHPFPVSAGLKGEGTLAFLMRIPERSFSLQVVEEALNYLAGLHDEAVA